MKDAVSRLDVWVDSGLLTPRQADAIRAFEKDAGEGAGGTRSRIPLVTEALGYLGAALAFAAMGVALGQAWNDLSPAAHVAIPLVCTLVLLAAGSVLRGNPEPAYVRFASVLWFLSVASLAWLLSVVMIDVVDADRNVALVVGIGVAAYAAALYTFLRHAALQVAMLAGVLAFSADLMQRFAHAGTDPGGWIGLACIVVGGLWLVLAFMRILVPRELAFALGSGTILMGCQSIAVMQGATAHAGMLTGLVLSALLILGSVWLRDNILLAFGAVGLFGFLLGTVAHFFGETLGAPLVLLAAGVILLAVALMTMRLRRFTGPRPSAPRTA